MVEYNKDLVVAKVNQCFPNEDEEKILGILNLYGRETYERERERVQIAILKLSDGNLEKLRKSIEIAKSDYRDVLAYAEYPEEMGKDTWRMSDKEARRIREKDRQQYLNWLNG